MIGTIDAVGMAAMRPIDAAGSYAQGQGQEVVRLAGEAAQDAVFYGPASLQQPVQGSAQAQTDPNAQRLAAQQEAKKKQEKDPNNEAQMSLLTKEINAIMSRINCDLSFEYHKDVNMLSVRMIDKKTGKVLKEIPPEDMIKSLQRQREWIGKFLDHKI